MVAAVAALPPKPDTAAAIDFLRQWSPEDYWCLTAIIPDGNTDTQTFLPSEAEEAARWVTKYQGRRNLYFTLNTVIQRADSKPTKSAIANFRAFHVDVDPRAGEDLASEQARIESLFTSKLPTGVPPPSVVWFSGGGYQAAWLLAEPLAIPPATDAEPEPWKHGEAINRGLEQAFGADAVHNCDRLMRLVGGINVPNRKKVAKGRTPALARLIFADWSRRYTVGDFEHLRRYEAAPKAPTSPGAKETSRRPRAARTLGEGVPMGTEELRAWAAANGKTIPDATLARIATGDDPIEPGKYPSRSEALFAVCCELVRAEVPDHVILAAITDRNNLISASVLEQPKAAEYAQRQIDRARDAVGELPPILHADSPLESARVYIARRRPTLMHNNDDWLAFDGAAYVELEEKTVRAELYNFLDRALTPGKEDAPPRPFNPNKTKVANVVDALQGVAHRPRDAFAPPCWLEGDGPPPHELVACRNGLLHLPSGELLELTPRFFTRNALTFDHDANAPEPVRWLKFLAELWPDEQDAISTLQEVFGYALIPDTSQQKIFLLVGPKRSGKGTIARVLTELVGKHNTCAPTLASLGAPFGLEGLVGKQLAISSDVRLGAKTDHAALAENLLRISGEDMVTVARKYKRDWDGKLAVRFLIMTNIMPKFADASGALANRFVPLVMSQSFFGRENPALLAELLAELPGILNWAIVGWRRFKERGHFDMSASSREAIQDLADMASPEAAFIRDECDLDPEATAPKAAVFIAWKAWCERNNVFANTMEVFSARLRAASNGRVSATKLRAGDGKRTPSFSGIRLKTCDESPF